MSIEERRLAFLEETIEFYSKDPSRRAVDNTEEGDFDFCLYKASNGNKCAIGRHIPDKKYLPSFEGTGLNNNEDLVKALPKELLNLGIDFLNHVQRLHDNKHNWNTNYISDRGKLFVHEIKRKFCTEKVYKIKHIPTGKFLNRRGDTDTLGRIFSTIGHAKLCKKARSLGKYYEIVPFSVQEIE